MGKPAKARPNSNPLAQQNPKIACPPFIPEPSRKEQIRRTKAVFGPSPTEKRYSRCYALKTSVLNRAVGMRPFRDFFQSLAALTNKDVNPGQIGHGQNSDEFPIFHYRQAPNLMIGHDIGSFPGIRLGIDRHDRFCHTGLDWEICPLCRGQ